MDGASTSAGAVVPQDIPLWCPYCSAELPAGDVRVQCPQCGGTVDVPSARRASVSWDAIHALDREIAEIDSSIAQLTERRARYNLVHAQERMTYSAARSAAMVRDGAVEFADVVARPSAAPESSAKQAPRQRQPSVPLAVVLQGTGAALLLAALITVSAVLWGILPTWGQVGMLVLAVVLVGALALVTRRSLPTTSTVLAVLTSASGLVTLASIPRFADVPYPEHYPAAAGVLFTAVALVAGRLTKLRLWWLIGVASAPGTGLLVVLSILGAADDQWTPQWRLAVGVLVFTPIVAGMFTWSRLTSHRDQVTSATAWWSAVVGSVPVGLAAASAGLDILLSLRNSWIDVLPAAVIVTSAALLTLVARWASIEVASRWADSMLVASALLAALAAVSPVVGHWTSAAWAIGSASAVVVVTALLLIARSRQGGPRRRWLEVFGVALASAALVSAFAAAGPRWLGTVLDAASLPLGAKWAWLAFTLMGLGLGVLLVVGGLRAAGETDRTRQWTIATGWLLAVFAWAFGWGAGLDFPGSFELVTVVAGGFACALLWLARRRQLDFGVPLRAVVVATAAPSLLAALTDPEFTMNRTWWRVISVIAATGLVAVWAGTGPRGLGPVAVGMALSVPLWAYLVAMSGRDLAGFPEVFVVPVAASAAVLTMWVLEPRTRAQWGRAVQWPMAAVAVTSVVMSLVAPFATHGAPQQVRVVVVILAACVTAAALRKRRWFSASAGIVAVVVTWWNVLVAIPPGGAWALEKWTVPTTAALIAISLTVVWAAQRPLPSMVTFGPPLIVALIPASFLASGQLILFDEELQLDGLVRVAFVLLTASGSVAVGAWSQRAGLLLPGMAALIITVGPIALLFGLAFGLWIPLLIGGTLLLVVGARLEHVRRQGRAVAVWFTHLH